MVRKVYDSFYGLAGQTEVFFDVCRGRSAKDPRRVSAEGMTGGTHAIKNSSVQLVEV
jgi:hypothetical protein